MSTIFVWNVSNHLYLLPSVNCLSTFQPHPLCFALLDTNCCLTLFTPFKSLQKSSKVHACSGEIARGTIKLYTYTITWLKGIVVYFTTGLLSPTPLEWGTLCNGTNPFLAARWRGVTPILSWMLTRAPFLSSTLRQSADPVLHTYKHTCP